jgi:hypothetical protein
VTEEDAWVELVNGADETIDLKGWRLELSGDGSGVYVIEVTTIISTEDYLVFYPYQMGVSLANGGEIRLLDETGEVIDSVELPAMPVDASYSLDADGEWLTDWPPSPGEPNSPAAPESRPASKRITARDD